MGGTQKFYHDVPILSPWASCPSRQPLARLQILATQILATQILATQILATQILVTILATQ